MSLIHYVEEHLALIQKHKAEFHVGNEEVDHYVKQFINSGYNVFINYCVKSELLRVLSMQYNSDENTLGFAFRHCRFKINIVNLEWAASKSAGVVMDLTKLDNDIITDSLVARALVDFSTVSSNDNPDLLEYVKAKINYISLLCNHARVVMKAVDDQIENELTQEAA